MMLNGDAPDAMMPSYHNAAVKTRPGFLPRGQGHGQRLGKVLICSFEVDQLQSCLGFGLVIQGGALGRYPLVNIQKTIEHGQ